MGGTSPEAFNFYKYDISWVGIDSGREGLWKEPVWTEVVRIISFHQGEPVYEKDSPIYDSLERKFPAEAWRAYERSGRFRPLFRDYPNPWTRTRVIDLSGKIFSLTELGCSYIDGAIAKAEILVGMFKGHTEFVSEKILEKPFSILASAFLDTPRSLSTSEVYWAVMKNYRPGQDNVSDVLKMKLPKITRSVEATPFRRVRNMLTLLRSVDAIESYRRGSEIYWRAQNENLLKLIAY